MWEERHLMVVKNIASEIPEAIEQIKIFRSSNGGIEILGEYYCTLQALENGSFELEEEEEEKEDPIFGPRNVSEFRCMMCMVIKHIDLKEKKGKQKLSVCKQVR